jgi:hypothetical protein
MGDGINLADPDFEPTDAQLVGLSTRAFAGVREQHERQLCELRASVERARAAALAALAARLATIGRAPA